MIQDAIKKAVRKEDLSGAEMVQVMEEIMTGKTTDAQIGSFLTALAMKGETIDEITGAVRVMREKATPIPHAFPDVVDLCGTGGDGSRTFNISTTAAFVAAGAGARVAKHGNRAMSSGCGSADVLKELNVNIEAPPAKVGECIDKIGIGFMFAPLLHTAMKFAIGPRREMGIRTVFNILGPLTNPAGAKRQIIGVFDPKLVRPLAEVLRNLGSVHVITLHGDGMDEITPCGTTSVAELKQGKVHEYNVFPRDFGVVLADRKALSGGDVKVNAEILKSVLSGEKGPRRDAVVLNASAAIYVSGSAQNFQEAASLAAESIDSGAALKKLSALAEMTN
jgi:anthranilate phosphoribosyltransferase